MTGIFKTLTAVDQIIAEGKAYDIAHALAPSTPDDNKFVFFAAFDGTNNSADPSFASNSQSTAVHEIFEAINAANPEPKNVTARYFPGVGTPPTETGSSTIPTAQIIKTAQDAYDQFAIAGAQWLRQHPDGELSSMIMSFSRGGGSAAVFSQMLYENGLVTVDKKVLIPPGKVGAVSAALILDPVLTGISGNMSFPDSVQNLTIVRADDEHRKLFRGADYGESTANILHATGNHGDIGGFYDQGLSGLYLESYHDYFKSAGLKIRDVPENRKYDISQPVTIHSESMLPLDQLALSPWNIPEDDYDSPRKLKSAGVSAQKSGNGSIFTDYKGALVIKGSGVEANVSENSVIVLPNSSATISGIGMNVIVGGNSNVKVVSNAQVVDDYGNPVTSGDGSAVVTGSHSTIFAGANSSVEVSGANVTVEDGGAKYIHATGNQSGLDIKGDPVGSSLDSHAGGYYANRTLTREIVGGKVVNSTYSYTTIDGASYVFGYDSERNEYSYYSDEDEIAEKHFYANGTAVSHIVWSWGEIWDTTTNSDGSSVFEKTGNVYERVETSADGTTSYYDKDGLRNAFHNSSPSSEVTQENGATVHTNFYPNSGIVKNIEKVFDDGSRLTLEYDRFLLGGPVKSIAVDNLGNVETRIYDAEQNWNGELHEANGTTHFREGLGDGSIISDLWTAVDGTSGSDSYNGTALASRFKYNNDGSIDQIVFGAGGAQTQLAHFAVDGRSIVSVGNDNGNIVSTVIQTDNSYVETRTDSLGTTKKIADYNGNLISKSWELITGVHGREDYFNDGTSASIIYSEKDADGAYTATVVDRDKTKAISYYGRDDRITETTWRTTEGKTGADTYGYTEKGNYIVKTEGYLPGGVVKSVTFDSGIVDEQILVKRSGHDLVLQIDGIDSEIVLHNWGTDDAYRVGEISFPDGMSWNAARLMQEVKDTPLMGTDGNDSLQGWVGFDENIIGLDGDDYLVSLDGNDTLDGGSGNDSLTGGGNDTYIFGRGYGHDTIYENNSFSGDIDTIVLKDGIKAEDVTLERNGDDLQLHIGDSDDWITIRPAGFIWPSGNHGNLEIENIQFADGVVWTKDDYLRKIEVAPVLGSSEDDTLNGWDGINETLRGFSGNDRIFGGSANDQIEGGAGDDYLDGRYGDDTYLFSRGDGYDQISEYDYNYRNLDVIQFGDDVSPENVIVTRSGNGALFSISGTSDKIMVQGWAYGADYRIEELRFADGTIWNSDYLDKLVLNSPNVGTNGDDYLQGLYGVDDTLVGLQGNDVIQGSDGSDTIDGGTGSDNLFGNYGSDTYLFRPGDGDDVINESEAYFYGGLQISADEDAIRFTAGVTSHDIKVSRDGNNVVLEYGNGGDRITIQDWRSRSGHQIEKIIFADGENWGVDKIKEEISALPLVGTAGPDFMAAWPGLNENLQGLEGDDQLFSGSGNDTLSGGSGNDYLIGESGNDSYIFERGDGQDVISESGYASESFDTIRFGKNVAEDDIVVSRSYGDVIFSINDTSDQITVQGWSFAPDFRIEKVQFEDGRVWDADEIARRLAAPTFGSSFDDYLVGWDGINENLQGLGGNDYIIGANRNDSLVGGEGNDYLEGREGSDTYKFDLGFGNDEIWEEDIEGDDNDVIQFGDGISKDHVVVERSGADLILKDSQNGGSITILGWGNEDGQRIENVQFSDGSVWDKLDILHAASNQLLGTSGVDFIQAWGGGDEIINGGGGNDALIGADGGETLSGDDGNDFLLGGSGDDLINVGSGSNVISYNHGDGNDIVHLGGQGGNTISLGGGVEYAKLMFSRSGDDLVFTTGDGEGITLMDWYGNQQSVGVTNLQIIFDGNTLYDPYSNDELVNKKVQQFDFAGLVEKFDQSLVSTPSLSPWSLASSLLEFQVASNDFSAIGGDLSYNYGAYGNLDSLSSYDVKSAIADNQFGIKKQDLQSIIF
jgi:Ca2+-binding RTX toxin-like protein